MLLLHVLGGLDDYVLLLHVLGGLDDYMLLLHVLRGLDDYMLLLHVLRGMDDYMLLLHVLGGLDDGWGRPAMPTGCVRFTLDKCWHSRLRSRRSSGSTMGCGRRWRRLHVMT